MTDHPNEPTAQGEEWITLAEAAEISGLSHTSLSMYAANGRLKAKKFGPIWLTTRADLQAYLDSRHQGKKL